MEPDGGMKEQDGGRCNRCMRGYAGTGEMYINLHPTDGKSPPMAPAAGILAGLEGQFLWSLTVRPF